MPFNAEIMEELNLLLQFHDANKSSGIKVHSSAREEIIKACQGLFDKQLITRSDGGYLTDAGIEALNHTQAVAGLLKLRKNV